MNNRITLGTTSISLKLFSVLVGGFLGILLLIHIVTRNSAQAPLSVPLVSGAESVALLAEPLAFTGSKSVSSKSIQLPEGALSAKDMLKVTYNLHGVCLLDGPSSTISLIVPDANPSSVSLSRYGQNCLNGKQSIDIPFSQFANLANQEKTSAIRFTFWYPTRYTIDILRVVTYNSGGAVLGLSSDIPKEPVRKSFPRITPLRPSPYAASSRE